MTEHKPLTQKKVNLMTAVNLKINRIADIKAIEVM